MQGASDSPLSVQGRDEARRTAEALSRIKFDTAFSSPMGRALETARLLVQPHQDLELTVLADLHEMDFGFYEKKVYFASPDEVPHGFRRLSLLAKVMVAQVTGEPLSHVFKRAKKSWECISAAAPEGTLLVVSHGVLLNYLLKHLLAKPDFAALRPGGLHPCSITEIMAACAGDAKLIRLNDTAHLK